MFLLPRVHPGWRFSDRCKIVPTSNLWRGSNGNEMEMAVDHTCRGSTWWNPSFESSPRMMVWPLLLFHRPSFHQLYIRELFSMHFISRAYFHWLESFTLLSELALGALRNGSNWAASVAGWIKSQLCWLTGGSVSDRVINPICLRHCVPHPPCLFSFYSSRGITAKKAAKQAVKGLSNSSKGIRRESCTSTEQRTPVAHVKDSRTG